MHQSCPDASLTTAGPHPLGHAGVAAAEEGTTYFLDPDTKELVWEKPAGLHWVKITDNEGQEYY